MIVLSSKFWVLICKLRLTSHVSRLTFFILFTVHCSLFTSVHAMEAKVVVAKSLIKRGQVIKAEDIALEGRDFLKVPANISEDMGEIIDKAAKVDIRAGNVIKSHMVDYKKVIKRGDNVIILAEGVNLRITASGQAVEDGREGKSIKVLNLSSKKIVVGRVAGDSTVVVQF